MSKTKDEFIRQEEAKRLEAELGEIKRLSREESDRFYTGGHPFKPVVHEGPGATTVFQYLVPHFISVAGRPSEESGIHACASNERIFAAKNDSNGLSILFTGKMHVKGGNQAIDVSNATVEFEFDTAQAQHLLLELAHALKRDVRDMLKEPDNETRGR